MSQRGIVNSDCRLMFSWRYVSPQNAKSQNYHKAFILRPRDEGKLSLDVNSRQILDDKSRREEIYAIYEKKNFDPSATGIFAMIDLINSQVEANVSTIFLSPEIDGPSHCSLEYLNGFYEDDVLRNEVFNILYNNIKDEVPSVKPLES